MRHCHLLLILTVVLTMMPAGLVQGHPAVFFPGQAFCPARTLMVGTIVMHPPECFSVFLMRTPQNAFLGFVPAGQLFVPSGQIIGLGTSLGARIRARILLLVPIAVPIFLVPVDTSRPWAFQVEDMGGTLGIRFAGDLDTLVPLTPTPPSQSTSRWSSNSSGIPVPNDLHILPPGSDIPQDEAAFSGRWIGQWKGRGESIADEGLPHILAIEQITRAGGFLRSERRAVGVFAWGRSPRWEVFPGWLRVEGVFERGILQLALPGGAHATYRMGIDGTLDATYESPNYGVMSATLSRTVGPLR